MSLDDTDPSFDDDLRDSEKVTDHVRAWLTSWGWTLEPKEPLQVRPDPSERFDYSDKGDIKGEFNGIKNLIDVKGRNLHFTRQSNYPYPSTILDPVGTFGSKPKKPDMYIIVNQNGTHAGIVNVPLTFHHWIVNDIHARGRTRAHYLCPVEHVEFVKIQFGPKREKA